MSNCDFTSEGGRHPCKGRKKRVPVVASWQPPGRGSCTLITEAIVCEAHREYAEGYAAWAYIGEQP